MRHQERAVDRALQLVRGGCEMDDDIFATGEVPDYAIPMPDYFSVYEAIAQRDDASARIAMVSPDRKCCA